MAVAVRVIPCLDVDAGRVVKGINFTNLVDAGDPVELARAYDAEGADELTFLDVTVHIVGLGFDADDASLAAGLTATRGGRRERCRPRRFETRSSLGPDTPRQ